MFKLKEELFIVLLLVVIATGAMGCRSYNTSSSTYPDSNIKYGGSQSFSVDSPSSSGGGSCPSCH
jgi:hypothetical protein